MKLTLQINGEDKIFQTKFVSGRMLRKTLEFNKTLDPTKMDASTLDGMVDYVVDLFGDQFTQDQFYDGIPAKTIYATVIGCINEVVNGADEATKDLQNPNEQATT